MDLPVSTEVGYATLRIADRLLAPAIQRSLQAAGQTPPHITWVHTEPIAAPFVGPNINIGRQMGQYQSWEEGGHVLASALG